MRETSLRWEGRLGSLKFIGVMIAIVALGILIASIVRFTVALKNSAEPQDVQLSQLVHGGIGNGYYVRVSGVAIYDVGYTETEDGRTTRNFYFLLDPDTGDMILIEHHSPTIVQTDPEEATITGMTRSTPSDLKAAIEEDKATFDEAGVQTNPSQYVKDGESPPSRRNTIPGIIVGAVLMLGGVIPLFFPTTVFGAYPVDASAARQVERSSVKATGRFVELKQLQPTIEFGRKFRSFNDAVANIIPVSSQSLIVYIHHVLKTKAYGITVRTTESDWGVLFDTSNVLEIEPGKIYGWKDRWAVRFQYRGPKDKPEPLYLIFDQVSEQAAFVNWLQRLNFTITPVAQ